MSQRDTIHINRTSLGLVLGMVGVVGLLAAVILLAWFLTFNGWVLGAVLVGLVGLLSSALVAPAAFARAVTGRQARYGTSAIFAGTLLSGSILLAYIFVARANISLDATAGASFTLSDTSLDLIDRIPENRTAKIVGFYSSSALPMRERDNEFLQRYEEESDGRVQVEYVNPRDNPALAQFFNTTEDGDTVMYLEDENGEMLMETVTFVAREDKQERYISATLNRMLNNRVFKVYFDESRSTLSIFNESETGLTIVDNNLRANGIQTDTLDIFQLAEDAEPIPPDAAVLVLARPLLPYQPREVNVIKDYLERGGSLLILADATLNDRFFLQEGSALNTYLYDTFGLRARDAIVVDPASSIQTPLDLIGYATFTEPPIGARLPDAPTYFRIARALDVSADKPPTVANGRIISQSEAAYGESDLELVLEANDYQYDAEEDLAGPLDIAAWAWDEGGTGAKLVMVGDADFAMNEILAAGVPGNEALIIESIRWLAGFEQDITFGFSANPSGIPTIFISGRQLDLIGLITIIGMPLFVLLTGITVWYRRTFA